MRFTCIKSTNHGLTRFKFNILSRNLVYSKREYIKILYINEDAVNYLYDFISIESILNN